MNKLRVISSVSEVLSGVFRHYFQLILVAWPAILLLLVSFGALVWMYLSTGILDAVGGQNPEEVKAALEQMEAGGTSIGFILIALLAGLASAVAAVRWHRFVLLGEGADGRMENIRVLRAEDGSYIWTSIKLILVYMLFIAAFFILVALVVMLGRAVAGGGNAGVEAFAALAAVIGYVFALMIMFRLMVALPDAAMGRGGRVIEIFRRTHGNSWRLLGAFMLLFLLGAVVLGVVGFALGLLASVGIVGAVIGVILYAGAYLFFLMMQITMLSVSYREIIGLPGSGESPAAV
ncbi:hypothetical protein [Parvibaculum sp.]|uniref:hypothetical protein n=1 Tax=Parvibaculum sp. TaxID=2024848 RepID=UPI000C95DD0D|nr:hypothetical protein [Parvibaculum sp.]MAB12670.1 hypothetical protein [Parvibaculum sp.]